jgi:hypothetical protein
VHVLVRRRRRRAVWVHQHVRLARRVPACPCV